MLSRTTRILVLLALIALVAWVLVRRAGKEGGDAPERLASFDPGRVDAVVLGRPGETLRFVREDSLWWMRAPLRDEAEYSSIASLLDALEHADVARNLGEVEQARPFGLDPPLVHITLLAGADTLLHASVGKRTVDEAWCYARTDRSRDLLLIPTGVARAATHPVEHYRNQRVVTFQLSDVARYTLASRASAMSWWRRDDGWRGSSSPADTAARKAVRGDSVAVVSVLRRLRGLRVAEFRAESDSLPPQTFAGHVVLWGRDGAPLANLVFHRLPDGRWAARDGRTVIVDGDLTDLFQHTLTGLRDRRLLQFSPLDAQRIRIDLPSCSGELVRAGGQWSFPNPAAGRIDPERAAGFVRALRALTWDEPAPSPHSVSSNHEVLITGAEGAILDEVRIEPRTGASRWYASGRSSGGTRLVDPAKFEHLAALFRALGAP